MGMFDTVHFSQPLPCVDCEAEIPSTQTKAFECILGEYRVGDCIGHAEELRVVREGLYCDACRAMDKQFVYFVVYRGILVDVALDLPAAEAQLRGFSFEKLLLWYHDLYAKHIAEQGERRYVERFLHDVAEWYREDSEPTARDKKLIPFLFIHFRDILEASPDALVAIEAYLAKRKAQKKVDSENA